MIQQELLQVEIGSGLYRLALPFDNEFSFAHDQIASLLRDKWKEKALETRSYRSGAYYRNIRRAPNAIRVGDIRERDVVSDVGYGDIIESIGWGAHNPPRFPAEKGIEAADPDIEKILSDTAGRVIDEIQRG